MKRFAIAIAALFALAVGVKACPPMAMFQTSSCNVAQVQSFAFVPTVQVQTAFVPVTTFQTAFVPVQTQVIQQQVVAQQFAVQPFVAAQVVSPFVNVNVNVRQRARLFGNRSVVRSRQVIRMR